MLFEPGSIFKPFLAAAALEEKVVHPAGAIRLQRRQIQVADRVIKRRPPERRADLHGRDRRVEQRGDDQGRPAARQGTVLQIHHRFRIRQKTGVDMPGEIPGLLKDQRLWSGVSIGSIAIGQEIGVTPIQMAAAYGALANGGMLMKPYIVSEIVDQDGGRARNSQPQAVGRVIIGRDLRQGQQDAAAGRRGRHGPEGEARRLHRGRQDRHGAEDRPADRRSIQRRTMSVPLWGSCRRRRRSW